MSENHVIDGMTPEELIIYKKGYSRGLEIGNFIAEERIIKLLAELSFTIEKVEHNPHDAYIIDRGIALIKGEQKSQSEHLTDAIQATVWVYQEGEKK